MVVQRRIRRVVLAVAQVVLVPVAVVILAAFGQPYPPMASAQAAQDIRGERGWLTPLEIGRTYLDSVYSHCGVRDATFDGRRWLVASSPESYGYSEAYLDDDWSPPDQSTDDWKFQMSPPGWGFNSTEGTVMLVQPGAILFQGPTGPPVRYMPLPLILQLEMQGRYCR